MKNLVFCSTASLSRCQPELFGPDRQFDVLVHLYDENPQNLNEGELINWTNFTQPYHGVYHYFMPGEKFNVAAKAIAAMPNQYDQFAFLDDDLEVRTDDLNRLFQIGSALRLPLFQPSLKRGSYCNYEVLYQRTHEFAWQPAVDRTVRLVPFVEMMAPFFSREALMDCLPTFDINESGWGIDRYVWPRVVRRETYVVDGVSIGHFREPSRRMRVLRNGLTPYDELWIQKVCFDPENAPFKPKGR